MFGKLIDNVLFVDKLNGDEAVIIPFLAPISVAIVGEKLAALFNANANSVSNAVGALVIKLAIASVTYVWVAYDDLCILNA